MIDLTRDEALDLAKLKRAGSLPLGEIATSTAIRMAMLGLVEITRDRPQMAVITRQGRAFAHRVAA